MKRIPSRSSWLSLLGAAAAVTLAASASADPPPMRATDAVPDPGKGIASSDDTSAIAVNPANLGFIPGWELRWNTVWTGEGSPYPTRGHSIASGLSFWRLATGLRVDIFEPPKSSPLAFHASSHWIRWALALNAGPSLSIGNTLGWAVSDSPALGGYVSATSGFTTRPVSWLSLSAVARDWNEPVSDNGRRAERRYDLGFALRPFGTSAAELGFESAFYEKSHAWLPKATAAIEIPRVGRVRGDLTIVDPESDPHFLATAGLDLELGFAELSGGGVFGDALTNAGTGFFAGAALRAYRDGGVRFPAKVARVRIKGTPGVRGHTRLLRRLWRIADDPEIKGVALVMGAEPASSLAHAEEVADAIRLIRAKGKRVLCHLEDAGGRALYVCSQANRIAMNPAGGLRYSGVSAQYYYFGGLLKKLGVRADFVRIGAHKLAAEQFTNAGGSEIARLDHQELVDELAKTYRRGVAEGRKLPEAEVEKRIANGPFVAAEARNAGFVDVLAYQDEIDRVATEMMGEKTAVSDDDPAASAPRRWGEIDKVGVVYLSGDMVDGESQYIPLLNLRIAGSQTIVRALRRMREDRTIKSVVFRIETGGGSSLAADVILREASLLAKAKPLVVSMGSQAASGGYYASMAGKKVFANPATVTGSIGIFYGKVDVVGLLDKLGLRVESYRSAPRADAESFFRPFTDDERRELGVKVKQFYDLFIGRVSEGRHMKPEAVDAVARGKVWTGRQALSVGLVDKLGGLREALAEARRLGGLPDAAPFIELPEEDDSILGFLLKQAGLSISSEQTIASVIPPAFLQIGRVLAPFMIYDSNKPLARAEIEIDEPPGSD